MEQEEIAFQQQRKRLFNEVAEEKERINLQASRWRVVKNLHQKSNLHYTRFISPKRVTSGGAHLRGLAPVRYNTAPKKRRSGGEPLATLCPV